MKDAEHPKEQETEPLWKIPEDLVAMAQSGGTEMIAEVFTVFQEDTACRLNRLRTAVLNRDCSVIRQEAHSIKGSAAQVGAALIASKCREMEQLAEAGTNQQQISLLEQIEQVFGQVRECLSASHFGGTVPPEGIRA